MARKFLIYISYSYGLPVGIPLEKEILHQGHQVRWFADMAESKEAIKNRNTCNSVQEILYYNPHIVLTATDHVPDFIPGIKVQVFHGFPANKRKGIDQFKIRGFFDLYCTQGPSSTQPFEKQRLKHKNFEVVETGWSKLDPMFPLEKVENKKPVILIASTFTKSYSLALKNEVVAELERLSKTRNWKFLAVLHPKLDRKVYRKFKALEHENFTFYDTTDLIPLYKMADVMLADTTSALSEFLIHGKPVVTYKNNMPGPHMIDVQEVAAIEPAIEKALNPPADLINEINQFIDHTHPTQDGRSSERVVKACLEFLEKDKSHLKSKPLNLIRRFKVRKMLKDFSHETISTPPTLSSPAKKQKLTAILPVYNESHNVEHTLKSVAFADEIMVVDSYSTDDTVKIAKKYTDFIIQRDFKYPASQKNWAIPQASHEWILLLDADERVTPALQDEIEEILANPKPDIQAYWIYRKNHFMGREVRYSGWQNDKVIRLFKKSYNRYEDKMVHEEIVSSGKVGYLKNRLYHNTYVNLNHYLIKLNKYADWQARDYDNFTGRLTPFHFVLKPVWKFFKHYIIQQGFRDGVVGFSISFLQSYSVVLRYIKLWLYRRDIK